MDTIHTVLMKRDGMSSEEADELIDEAKTELNKRLMFGDITDCSDICGKFFGLEPDYLDELIG